MSAIIVITAVGQDRPGIIAALSGAVYGMGGNLEDATMTRLHGAFAAMLSAKLPDETSESEARAQLAPIAQALQMTINVQTVSETPPPETDPDHLLTIYGADRPGIVYQATQFLANKGINITDMDTRISGTRENPLYVMLLEIAAGAVDLSQDISDMHRNLGVDIALKPLNAEAL